MQCRRIRISACQYVLQYYRSCRVVTVLSGHMRIDVYQDAPRFQEKTQDDHRMRHAGADLHFLPHDIPKKEQFDLNAFCRTFTGWISFGNPVDEPRYAAAEEERLRTDLRPDSFA